MYSEDEYLMLSGLQHFMFCRRQWALIHIEQQWEDNYRTADGEMMHSNVHDETFHEKRGEVIITRAMAVSSSELGLSGECDVVEFHKDNSGINIFGYEGKYSVIPVEYKRGSPKENLSDSVQLAAQAMCLEEMLCCSIPYGFLFYGETRRRQKVQINDELRQTVKNASEEMHELYQRNYTPKVRKSRSCNACSLKNICLPFLNADKSAQDYVRKMLKGE